MNLFLALRDPEKLYNISKNTPIEDENLFNQFKTEIFDENLKLEKDTPNFEIAYK